MEMTREEAKEFLVNMSYKLGSMSMECLSEKDGEKMREAIKVLEQEPCEDVVSRNAITKTLNEMDRYIADELTLCGSDNKFPKNEVFIVDDVYEQIVEQLSSVTDKMCFTKDIQLNPLPKERREWILVDERLPETEDYYLVTDDAGGMKTVEISFFVPECESPWDYVNVTAWMPLPEPYTESEE